MNPITFNRYELAGVIRGGLYSGVVCYAMIGTAVAVDKLARYVFEIKEGDDNSRLINSRLIKLGAFSIGCAVGFALSSSTPFLVTLTFRKVLELFVLERALKYALHTGWDRWKGDLEKHKVVVLTKAFLVNYSPDMVPSMALIKVFSFGDSQLYNMEWKQALPLFSKVYAKEKFLQNIFG